MLEAEITGGLEHPGIVPVYGLGTYGDGRPYYAMRFIRGESLKEAIGHFHGDESLKKDLGRRSLELRKLLRRFMDVCNAIGYAHCRGVLHRDIKPGNVIVGKHGETLVVDWGLAKATGKSDPSAGRADALAELGQRQLGDAAGLGPGHAGLHEPGAGRGKPRAAGAAQRRLQPGRHAVLPADGKAAGRGRRHRRRAASRADAASSRPPRQVDPTIDRALEAVCLKAMALKPADRYATPKALADDVERWMADEPVTAWREPFSRRARRWGRRTGRRSPPLAAAVLVALAGTAAVLAVQTQPNFDLQAANIDLAVANAQVKRSNADLEAANGARASSDSTWRCRRSSCSTAR